MTAAQILEQRGEQRGREEALRSTLIKLLSQRFGALPDKALERIAQAGFEELTQWVERILVAPTLDHIFDDPSAH